MPSIQQSYNQLLGTALGAATAGAHIYSRTGHYEAAQAERKIKAINKNLVKKLPPIEGLSDAQLKQVIETGEQAEQLRKTALTKGASTKRFERLLGTQETVEGLKGELARREAAAAAPASTSIDPNEPTPEQMERAEAEQEAAYDERLIQEAQEDYAQANAENEAFNAQMRRIQQNQSQRDALRERQDMLRKLDALRKRGENNGK